MFDHFTADNPGLLDAVVNEQTAVDFVVRMLDSYGVFEMLFYNPEQTEPPLQPGEDDLFRYYLHLVIRFLPNLAIDMCEAEGDAEGLLAIQRLMVTYFLGANLSSQNIKYADYTLFDIVVLLSSSPRTRARREQNCVVNPSGTAGGGLFWDKYCEHVVRMVKECLRRQHGGLDDIRIEKDVGGLSVLASLNHHGRLSLLKGKIGKEHCQDYVKQPARMIIQEQIKRLDPFQKDRAEPVTFCEKVRASPTAGLKKEEVLRFLPRKEQEFSLKHQFV